MQVLPKIIITGIKRGGTIKHRRECGEGLFVFGLWSGRSDRCGLNGEKRMWRRRGSEEGEAGGRVQEVQTQMPRSGFAVPRRKVREEPNAGVRSQIPRPDFVVCREPEEVPEESPGLQRRRRPVTIKARVTEKNFSLREASASFQAERFFCSG
jgi:hypothetical protein